MTNGKISYLMFTMKIRELLKSCISIDLETTHLDPNVGSVISAGACLFDRPDELYIECAVRNGALIDPYSLKVNGENKDDLLARSLDFENEFVLYERVVHFARKHNALVIIGKNPEFDYNWLKSIQERYKNKASEFPFSYRKINWANMVIPLMIINNVEINHANLSSDSISAFAGLSEEVKPHNALNGAIHNRACVERILEMYMDF